MPQELVDHAGVPRNGHRNPGNRETLIGCARAAGFTLAQIARFLVATPGECPEFKSRLG
ncbi:hypothetical protein [Cryptosporangium sp. NPDC048952]|uniref:hypothetical protein n=1 Tax=Cryptosporangium sp. NPDC048952 TaxID=3363961 RepID=UPI0037122DCA